MSRRLRRTLRLPMDILATLLKPIYGLFEKAFSPATSQFLFIGAIMALFALLAYGLGAHVVDAYRKDHPLPEPTPTVQQVAGRLTLWRLVFLSASESGDALFETSRQRVPN